MKINFSVLLLVLLFAGHARAQTDSSRHSFAIVPCYDRYSVKESWAQMLAYLISEERAHPINLQQIYQATGDNPLCYVKQHKQAFMDSILSLPEIKAFFPSDIQFYWDKNLTEKFGGEFYYGLYGAKNSTDSNKSLQSRHIDHSDTAYNKEAELNAVQLYLTPEGQKQFQILTAGNIGNTLAILVDGRVISAPRVYMEVNHPFCEISGVSTKEEVAAIAASINKAIGK